MAPIDQSWIPVITALITLAGGLLAYARLDKKIDGAIALSKEKTSDTIRVKLTDAEIAEKARQDATIQGLIGFTSTLVNRLDGITDAMLALTKQQSSEHELELERIQSRVKSDKGYADAIHEQTAAVAQNTLSIKRLIEQEADTISEIRRMAKDITELKTTYGVLSDKILRGMVPADPDKTKPLPPPTPEQAA